MGKIINIVAYRQERKKTFLAKHKFQIDEYIQLFSIRHSQISYDFFRYHYLNNKHQQNEMAWDYMEFRETLTEAVSETLGTKLWEEVQRQSWYRTGCLSYDEIVDRLICHIVMGEAISGTDEA